MWRREEAKRRREGKADEEDAQDFLSHNDVPLDLASSITQWATFSFEHLQGKREQVGGSATPCTAGRVGSGRSLGWRSGVDGGGVVDRLGRGDTLPFASRCLCVAALASWLRFASRSARPVTRWVAEQAQVLNSLPVELHTRLLRYLHKDTLIQVPVLASLPEEPEKEHFILDLYQ